MPKLGYKQISCTDQEYEVIQEFVDRVSEQEGFKLRPAQAILKAIIKYEVKNGLAK